MMISGIVEKNVNGRLGRVHRLYFLQKSDGAVGVNCLRIPAHPATCSDGIRPLGLGTVG